MRRTIYVSERRNREIADFIKAIPPKEVSYEAVKLMEDGMKWRGKGNDGTKEVETFDSRNVALPTVPVLPAEEKTARANFNDITLEKKVASRDELEAKFDKM